MKVKVEIDGNTEEVDISFDNLTLRESVAVQKEIGNAEWDEFVNEQVARPTTILAVIAAKVRSRYPDVDIDQVDVDFITEEASDAETGLDPTETG
jgi:hypothetical protein